MAGRLQTMSLTPDAPRRSRLMGFKRSPEPNRNRDHNLTELCRNLALKLGLKKLATTIEVVWNARLRSTAGRATHSQSLIELNPKLKRFGDEEVTRTALHELAHLVAHKRNFGRRIQAHGLEWQQACVDLGIGGESVTHSLPLGSHRQRRRFVYRCSNCGSEVLRVRRIKNPAACLLCCKKHNRGRYDRRFELVGYSISSRSVNDGSLSKTQAEDTRSSL